MQVQKTVFISYRRTNIYMARAVYGNLRANGYDAFLDYQSLDSGDFSQSLLNQIAARAHFVVVLTPSALERCTSPDDWMRKEIEYAIQQKRNVIPLMFEGFRFEEVQHYLVSDWLKILPSYNGIRIPDDYFEEAMDRLRSSRYLDRPTETVIHPVAAQAAKAAQAAQVEADAAPPPTSEQLEAERLFESGYRKARLMSDYVGAIKDFDRVISLKPDDSEAYHWRGHARSNKGDKLGALQDFKIAIRQKSDDGRKNIILSKIALVEGDADLALNEAELGVLFNPNYDEAYLQRGLARNRKRDFDGAIEDCNEAIRLNPHHATAYFNRAVIYRGKEEYDKAIVDYNESIRINPQNPMAYNNRGNIYYGKKEYDRAIADYETALQIDPNIEFAKMNLDLARRAKSSK